MGMENFILDESQSFEIESVAEIGLRWMEFPHGHQRMRGFVILAGEVLRLPWMKAAEEPWLSLAYLRAVPEISIDGLDFRIEIESESAPAQLIGIGVLDNEMPKAGYSTWERSIPIAPGKRFRLVLRCGAGPKGQPNGDWLGLTLLSIGDFSGASRRRAQVNSQWRLANEIAHFESVYSSEFYKHRQVNRRSLDAGKIRQLPEAIRQPTAPFSLPKNGLCEITPNPDENVYSFAHRILQSCLPIKQPNFTQRLRDIYARLPNRPVRMLSLCAGEAGVEGALLAEANVPVNLCLLDINESLLDTAASRLPNCVEVDRVLGNANQLSGQLGRFDVVNITSGLHHIVELESVLSGIACSLAEDGEFWLIGEQVGRNGNRLWHEARAIANRLFCSWPASRRKNVGTGKVDEWLPDVDYSSACFEGIRSEEILQLLNRFFLPLDVFLGNCFLWRLFNAAYAANFDLGNADDIARVREAVTAELLHWANEGVGTELYGVYRKKQAQLSL